jgi:hypothetical protein
MNNAILETASVIEPSGDRATGVKGDWQPRPEWIRGKCPQCQQPLVSQCLYVGGRGYLILWICVGALYGYRKTQECSYKHVL